MFYIGGMMYEDMLVMHIPSSTRFNGSYQYYYHQYCKLRTRLQANSTDTLLKHL